MKKLQPFTVDDLEYRLDKLIRIAMDVDLDIDDDISRLETAKNIIILQWEANCVPVKPKRKAKKVRK